MRRPQHRDPTSRVRLHAASWSVVVTGPACRAQRRPRRRAPFDRRRSVVVRWSCARGCRRCTSNRSGHHVRGHGHRRRRAGARRRRRGARCTPAWLEHAPADLPRPVRRPATSRTTSPAASATLEFEAAPISNIGRDGTVHPDPGDDVVKSLRGNEGWHHDSTYMPLQAKGAVFSAEIVPTEGAATGWADMRAAYDELDDDDPRPASPTSRVPLAVLQPGPRRATCRRSATRAAATTSTATTTWSRRCARSSRCTPTRAGPTC